MAKAKIDMTKGAILPVLVRFSLPIMLTAIIGQLFNTADTVVVGRWGGATEAAREIALSAVGSCGPINGLLVTLFMGFSVGAGVLVSHAVGAREYDRIGRIVHTAVATAALCGVVLGALGFIFARPLLLLIGTPDAVIDEAVRYMRAYFCGVPAMMIYNYCASMLRSTGDSTRPLFFLTVSGTANVALNLVMVIGFSQGALGVGVATAASQWLSCAMVLIYMSRDNGLCHFSFRQLGIHWETLRRIVVIGLPAGIQSSMFAIGNVVMQSALNSFNNTALVSGNAIASNLGAYSRTFCDAMTAAANVYVGQNTGAKNHARIREGVRRTAITVTVASILTNALLNLCSAPIVALFAPGNAEIMHFARIKLLVSSSFYFFSHLADVYAGSTRGMGRSTLPMIVSVGGNCGVRILWIYTVFAWVHEPLVIFFAHGVSWFVTFVAQLVIYHRTVRRVGLRWEQEKNDAVAASA